MRLLHRDDGGRLSLTRDLIRNIPSYAILSHTWGTDEDEVNFDDLQGDAYGSKAGYTKLEFCEKQAATDGLKYFWVDTCCINKASSAELQEAITSMFSWYQKAAKCYVYLADVLFQSGSTTDQETIWEMEFQNARWFTRGWTLQELLAPTSVEFFSKGQERIGDKNALKELIYQITGIPVAALEGCPLSHYSIKERMSWAAGRGTTRKEDKAYCLLGIFEVSMLANYGEGEEWALARLEEEVDKRSRRMHLLLDKLPCANGAIYNSYEQHHTTCHPSTRLDILDQIQHWSLQPDTRNIFWLNGWAGTGKSTISVTFAKWLANEAFHRSVSLGASFFFKRGEGDRGNASRFFPTIVRQLVTNISGLESIIAEAIAADPTISDKALNEQFDKLFYLPLQVLPKSEFRPTLVIVVDALDECESEKDIKVILGLWSRLPQLSAIKLKLFITSRPELPIRLGFDRMPVDAHEDMILQDAAPRATIQRDIQTYVKHEFCRIREEFNGQPGFGVALSEDWPGDRILQDLADMAVPLFIVAATICRFIGDLRLNPCTRLKHVIDTRRFGARPQMEQTYLSVIQQMMANSNDPFDQDMLCQWFKKIVGSIAVLAEPLAISALSQLLGLSQDDIYSFLSSLRSVLQIPEDYDTPVRTLHLSFNEFLLSEALQHKPFAVNGPTTHLMLLSKCLELLSSDIYGLRENVCSLRFPGQRRRDIDPAAINEYLSSATQYACRHWVYHAKHSNDQISDNDQVHTFLQKHFLHWLEALSLLGRLAEAIDHIRVLQSLVSANEAELVSSFLEDARRFILKNRYIADLTPLQLYSSAIIFAPQYSLVRRVCGRTPVWIQTCPNTPAYWSAVLQKLEGHTDAVTAVAFSPDGSLLASGSRDSTIVLWNTNTGQEMQKIVNGVIIFGVRSMTFSPDSSLLASGWTDGTVRLRNITTGTEMELSTTPREGLNSVAFSPDSCLLASVSQQSKIRLWSVTSGQLIARVDHQGSSSVAFSSDGSILISASADNHARQLYLHAWQLQQSEPDLSEVKTWNLQPPPDSALTFSSDASLLASASDTVRVWDVNTGLMIRSLDCDPFEVFTLAFSFDRKLLALCLNDYTIRLWDGQEVKTLGTTADIVETVALSPDNSMLASGSDETVSIWHVNASGGLHQDGHELQHTRGFVGMMAFLPGKDLLAAGCEDGTIRLLSTITHREMQKLKGHTLGVEDVVYSSSRCLLASASRDKTVKLWNMNTAEVKTLKGHTSAVRNVIFSTDGQLLVSGSDDRTARLWNTTTGQEMQMFEVDTFSTPWLALSPDNSLLATAADSGIIHLWRIGIMEALQMFTCSGTPLWALAFSPNASSPVVAYCKDDTENPIIGFWNVNGKNWRQQEFEIPSIVDTISLSVDHKTILTNRGMITIGNEEGHGGPSIQSQLKEVFISKEGWIRVNGYDLLWLPPEYRNASMSYHDLTFAFGLHPDNISFLQLNHLVLDAINPIK